MTTKNLKELFIDELKDVCDAERRLTKALPKMAKAASSEELASAFEEHLKQTERHLTRVETVLTALEASPTRKTCQAMIGLLEEADQLMKAEAPPEIKDLMLIAAAQKLEHYEIATYRSLCSWGLELGQDKAVKSLQANLLEETAADELLTKLSLPLVAESSNLDGEFTAAAPSSRRTTVKGH